MCAFISATAQPTLGKVGADIDGEAADDYSGYSVSSVDGSTVAIGADGNDGNGLDFGHARLSTQQRNQRLGTSRR